MLNILERVGIIKEISKFSDSAIEIAGFDPRTNKRGQLIDKVKNTGGNREIRLVETGSCY